MESNSVCNHTSDKQNRTTAKRESDLITSMITDRIGRHDVLLPINHNHYNFRKTEIFSNSNWTEWSTIQAVIGRVISKSAEREAQGRFEITSTITP